MGDIKRFIHFGCWNNLNEGTSSNLTGVMDKIKQTINQEQKQKPDFLSVAGDNYYPEKTYKTTNHTTGEKNKKIIKKNLIDGFSKLPTDIDIYMILGNHDLEQLDHKNDDNDADEDESKICVFKDEIENICDKIHFDLFHTQYHINTLILMLDTSMYEETATTDYLDCYKYFFTTKENSELSSVELTIEKLKQDQLHKIITAIESCIYTGLTNVIMIGHHPIIGFKQKQNKDKQIQDIASFYDVLKTIYTTINNTEVKYYYLCADIHLYQAGIIELTIKNDETVDDVMTIHQYIVGTGGTALDTCPSSNNEDTPSTNNLKYKMTECTKTHGFLDCTIGGETPVFSFVEIQGGGKKVRKNKKTKKKRKRKKTKNKRKRKRKSTKRNHKKKSP